MSMLLLESDKADTILCGLQGGIVVENSYSNERAGPQAHPTKEYAPRREGARRTAPADQLMYAWSMSATRTTVETKPETLRTNEECPPEVYLG